MLIRFGAPLLLAILTCTTLSAQEGPSVEYGKIDPSDRGMLRLESDTAAEAYVLYDHLDLDFEYHERKGPIRVERIHRRLKLFKPSAYERANVTLSYDRDYRDIYEVEGLVQLPEGGTIVLRPEQIIRQPGQDSRETIKFTFPQLRPGATIEYRYTMRTNNILQPTTYGFQEDIPVRWAVYTATIPAYYDYVSLGANSKYFINEAEVIKRAWGPTFTSGAYSASPKLEHTHLRWAMKDLPAYEYQPYSNNFTDYLPKARLQLRGVQYPGRPLNSVFSTWQETVDELQDRKDFGRYYRNKGNYGRLWKDAEASLLVSKGQRTKIETAYRFVIDHYDWNGKFAILASESPNGTYAAGGGNSADLNIALLSLLNEAGVEAHPLLVSLRDGGAPIEAYPLLSQFDHLMVYTEVDGKPLILDANDADRPVGLPRVSALNHRGWVADKKNPRWVDINVAPAKQTVMAIMRVAADGQTTVHLRSRHESYFAFSARSELREMNSLSEAPLASTILAKYPDATVLKAEPEAAKVDQPDALSLALDLKVPVGQALNDYLYIQPVLLPMLDEGLDDVETRLYPIDFPYPWIQRYVAQIELPEGYVVDELPTPIQLRTEDGSIVAVYRATANPEQGKVFVNFVVELDRTLYAAAEYTGLRDMYRRIIELQEAPIVLRKAK